jgi:hypothetical protein
MSRRTGWRDMMLPLELTTGLISKLHSPKRTGKV